MHWVATKPSSALNCIDQISREFAVELHHEALTQILRRRSAEFSKFCVEFMKPRFEMFRELHSLSSAQMPQFSSPEIFQGP